MVEVGSLVNGWLSLVAQNILHWRGFVGITRPVLAGGVVAAGWVAGRLGSAALAAILRVALMVGAVLLAYQVMIAR